MWGCLSPEGEFSTFPKVLVYFAVVIVNLEDQLIPECVSAGAMYVFRDRQPERSS